MTTTKRAGRYIRQSGNRLGDHDIRAPTAELGASHRAVKTVTGWIGASERTVKHWLAATHMPKGDHLVSLVRHSDQVLGAILAAADHPDVRIAMDVSAVRVKLLEPASPLEGR